MWSKLAGFVLQSFQIDMNRASWNFWPCKSNPRYKSFRFWLPNPNSRIRNSGFERIQDLQICIFKDSFCAIVLRICEDSQGFVGFVKTGQIFENWLDSWFKTNLLKSDSLSTIQHESRICFVRHGSNLFGVRIHDHNTKQINVLWISYLIPTTLGWSLPWKC